MAGAIVFEDLCRVALRIKAFASHQSVTTGSEAKKADFGSRRKKEAAINIHPDRSVPL